MTIVRCNNCCWVGREEDLDILHVDAKDEDGNWISYEMCPNCKCLDALMDLDSYCFFDDDQLRTLWNIFEDVPMDPGTEEIEERFLSFPAGTHREEIWHWFDERYNGGVHALMDG